MGEYSVSGRDSGHVGRGGSGGGRVSGVARGGEDGSAIWDGGGGR